MITDVTGTTRMCPPLGPLGIAANVLVRDLGGGYRSFAL